jgi:hypothetical protein
LAMCHAAPRFMFLLFNFCSLPPLRFLIITGFYDISVRSLARS